MRLSLAVAVDNTRKSEAKAEGYFTFLGSTNQSDTAFFILFNWNLACVWLSLNSLKLCARVPGFVVLFFLSQ